MTFKEAEQQYALLVQQWQAGQLTPQQFSNAVDALRIQTPNGNWWSIRQQDGAWLWWNGSAWQEAIPPHRMAGPTAVSPASQKKKRRRWWPTCLVLLLTGLCCLGLVGGGGYLAVQAGNMSVMQLSSQLEGSGEISIVNTGDETITVRLFLLDNEEGETRLESDVIETFDIGGYGGLSLGRYRLEFSGESLPAGSCAFQIDRGDSYQFLVVPEGVAIVRDGYATQDSVELDVATSSLCRQ